MTLVSVALAAIGAFCVAANEPVFQDLLDTPAQKSQLASKTPYNGITLAGRRLVSVGQRGHIVYSDDQGKSWAQANVPVSSDLTAVSFPTSQKGWAVGHDGVMLHSADGGVTWSKQLDGRAATKVIVDYYGSHHSSGADAARLQEDIKQAAEKGADKPLLDVWFENETDGFVVGAFNLILHTSDGGKSWEPWLDRTDNPKRLHLYSIKSVGRELYVCGEQGLVLKFNRQTGRFCALSTPYKGTFFGITGKPGSLIAYGLRGNVVRSTDEGKSWQKIEIGTPVGLTGGTVMEDGRIILVNQAGHVLASADNGATFSPVKVEQVLPTSAVVALDKETIMLAGMSGMQKQSMQQKQSLNN